MSNLKSIFRIIKQLITILDKKQRATTLKVFALMIVMSVLELLGVSMVLPLMSVIINPSSLKGKWYMDAIFEAFPRITGNNLIIIFGVCIIFLFLVKNVAAIGITYYNNRFYENFTADTSIRILSSYYSRPYEFFVNKNSSDLLRGVNSDIGDTNNELKNLLQIIQELFSVLMLGLLLIYTDWTMAIGALILSMICFFGTTLVFKKKIKKAGKISWLLMSERNKYALQAINGVKEIYVTGRKRYFTEKYAQSSREYEKAQLTYNVISASPDRIIEGVCISGFMLLVCIRVISGVNTDEFIPTLGVFAMGAFRILPSISKISSRINSMIFFIPGLQSCYESIVSLRQMENNIQDSNISEGQENGIVFKNKLEVDGVSWRYSNSDRVILDNLSMMVIKGESVALIGPSGAGKTTLADIILGLYVPTEGRVTIDGQSIENYRNVRSRIIGYVPQAVYLIDDTIRANVAFGVDDKLISDEAVWSALEQAQLEEFVKSLPDGIDTMVGERGIRFSGGQRQRIAIARALYDNPDILVLDEATSALDSETETAVMEAIDKLKGNKTLIIIAHRLTTIRNCDRVYEIKDGVAIERNVQEVVAG